MEDPTSNLRQMVMRKRVAASGGGAALTSGGRGSTSYQHSPLLSPSTSYQDIASPSRGGNTPLIQQVGPDFSRLSRELNRVVLKIQHQSEVSADCPSHGLDTPQNPYAEPRRGSRTVDSGHSGRRVPEQTGEGRRSASAEAHSAHRGQGTIPPQEPNYQSLPRRLSTQSRATKVDRRQSFQDFKTFRDKFTGKVEFKNTLRSSHDDNKTTTAKQEEQWIKKNEREKREKVRKSRQQSESRDERSGSSYMVETDFNFRSPPSTRDSSRERRGRYQDNEEERLAPPRRGQVDQIYSTPNTRKDHINEQNTEKNSQYGSQSNMDSRSPNVKSPMSDYYDQLSPTNGQIPKDPLSPRRVEFADEIFSFKTTGNTPGTSRCQSPLPKSILRHTNSDPHNGRQNDSNASLNDLNTAQGLNEERTQSRPSNVAVRSNTTDLSFCRVKSPSHEEPQTPQQTRISFSKPTVPLTRPTSLIIPPSVNIGNISRVNSQSLVKIMVPDDHNDSDDTLTEVKLDSSKEEVSLKRMGENKADKPSRIVPPPLASWNRSQSFPPAQASSYQEFVEESGTNLRKNSDPNSINGSSTLPQSDSEGVYRNSDIDSSRVENNTLRGWMEDLEKQVQDNNHEIRSLKSLLAECLRRIDNVEVGLVANVTSDTKQPQLRNDSRNGHVNLGGGSAKHGRRPHSDIYSSTGSLGRGFIDQGVRPTPRHR